MLCFVLLVLIAPKLINRDAVRSRIEAAISKELGGTVTYDSMEFVIIPRPKIDFQNLKIASPVAATASAVGVKIYARLLPLLQRRFEISSITLDRPALELVLPNTGARSSKRTKQKTPTTAQTFNSVMSAASRAMPDLSLTILQGRLSLVRGGQRVLSLADLEAVLAFSPEPQMGEGNSDRASDDYYHITGKAQAVISKAAVLPGPLRISIGRFDVYPKNFVVAQSRARLLDIDMTLSGSVQDYLSAAPRSDIVFNGSIGQDASIWIRTLTVLPETVMVRAPLKVRDVRLRSSGTGPSSSLSLAGSVTAKDSATISFVLRHEPDLFVIDNLQVKDSESDAVLRLTSGKKDLDLAFSGTLTGTTLSRIFEREHMPFKRITGDIHVHLPQNQWSEVAAEGTLEGEWLIIPSPLTASIIVDRFSTQFRGRAIDLRPVVLSLGQNIVTVEGTAAMSDTGVILDLDVSADRISTASLQELTKGKKTESGSITTPSANKKLIVEGDLRLRTAAVTFPSYTADAVAITMSKKRDRITADLEHASICGIDIKGTLQTSDHGMKISLEPLAHGGKLDESLGCILHEDLRITGDYDLSGKLTGSGPWKRLLQSLQGNLDFTARQGHIRHDKIVEGVIAYLNSTSLFKGSHSSLLKEGVPYETIVLQGTLREGVVSLTKCVIRGRDLYITAEGDLDLRKDTLALNVLVAPFTRLDRLLSNIPIVKNIAGNALVVVPVRVEGTFHEPKMKPLPASMVGKNVTNLMKDIVQAPMKIIEPVIP
jgi:hypothetical protein